MDAPQRGQACISVAMGSHGGEFGNRCPGLHPPTPPSQAPLFRAFWPPDGSLQAIPALFQAQALISCHFGRSRETKRPVLLPNSAAVPAPGGIRPTLPLRTIPLKLEAGSAAPSPAPCRPRRTGEPASLCRLLPAVAARKQEASNLSLSGDSHRLEQGQCLGQQGLGGPGPTLLTGAGGIDSPVGHAAPPFCSRLGTALSQGSTG